MAVCCASLLFRDLSCAEHAARTRLYFCLSDPSARHHLLNLEALRTTYSKQIRYVPRLWFVNHVYLSTTVLLFRQVDRL